MLRTALKQPRIWSEMQKTRIIKSNNINLTNSIKKSIFLCIIFLYEWFISCCLFAYWLKNRRHLERKASHGYGKFSSDHVIFIKYLKTMLFCIHLRSLGQKKIYVCLLSHVKKNLGSVGINFFFKLSSKPEIVVPGSGIRYFIFKISGKPSFVLWRVTQFFYLLCSEFRQKASGWINKTLLMIKQQKWLSEFCVKIDRVASKN
jgi:hypothetical protein